MNKEFWNERFKNDDYYYGKTPNVFFKKSIDNLKAGKIYLPGDGEGRNGVYAAKMGWEVFAVDISEEGKSKAEKLASEIGVSINYKIAGLEEHIPPTDYFDAAAVIFLHFEANLRKKFHQRIINSLKTGGVLICEVYHKNQLMNGTGGPKEIDLLYTLEQIKEDFSTMQIEYLEHVKENLNEGNNHNGISDLIRLVARKK